MKDAVAHPILQLDIEFRVQKEHDMCTDKVMTHVCLFPVLFFNEEDPETVPMCICCNCILDCPSLLDCVRLGLRSLDIQLARFWDRDDKYSVVQVGRNVGWL
jgi:hypothetical protein